MKIAMEAGIPESVFLFHGFVNSVQWKLSHEGVEIEGEGIERTPGEPITTRKVWDRYKEAINKWSYHYKVPAELIIATICTESRGKSSTVRKEPGYISDEQTPHRISPGLMQTLISTAQGTLDNPDINRSWLLIPENSIMAGTAYIASQKDKTGFDPPKVACAYNAGGVYYQEGLENRWKMRQYPIGTGHHADRFIKWFNDFFYLLNSGLIDPDVTFFMYG
jgi:hypothetical protein